PGRGGKGGGCPALGQKWSALRRLKSLYFYVFTGCERAPGLFCYFYAIALNRNVRLSSSEREAIRVFVVLVCESRCEVAYVHSGKHNGCETKRKRQLTASSIHRVSGRLPFFVVWQHFQC
ncbi:unnamed protein product, partial [Ectocarpus sp. 12 AP-2014]